MGGHLAVAEYLAPKMEGHLFDSDDDGHTALHIAAYFGQLSIVEYLVGSCGFAVKAIDKVGLRCLLLVDVFCALSGHTCCMGTVNMCMHVLPVVFVCMESSDHWEPTGCTV